MNTEKKTTVRDGMGGDIPVFEAQLETVVRNYLTSQWMKAAGINPADVTEEEKARIAAGFSVDVVEAGARILKANDDFTVVFSDV